MIFVDFHCFSPMLHPRGHIIAKSRKNEIRWESKIFEFYTRHRFWAYKHPKVDISMIIDDEKKYISLRNSFLDDQKWPGMNKKNATDP